MFTICSQERMHLADICPTSIIGGSRGGREGRTPPPGRPNSFDFMQFSGKFGVFTPPPGGFTPPPRENPGSATVHGRKFKHNAKLVS